MGDVEPNSEILGYHPTKKSLILLYKAINDARLARNEPVDQPSVVVSLHCLAARTPRSVDFQTVPSAAQRRGEKKAVRRPGVRRFDEFARH